MSSVVLSKVEPVEGRSSASRVEPNQCKLQKSASMQQTNKRYRKPSKSSPKDVCSRATQETGYQRPSASNRAVAKCQDHQQGDLKSIDTE